ncbi:hypothetical protein CALCODRAFT_505415 [Calocera cornea HHB12733]|uniref:Uncharacterized protein n=1 Tax=Calocera cornea HHB12733 TaxID=1353952 RepID=A0A165K3V0_9BASI|nr:hypothetical protein CALCODRAFT_505415 [Calocera cornea HHB12733]
MSIRRPTGPDFGVLIHGTADTEALSALLLNAHCSLSSQRFMTMWKDSKEVDGENEGETGGQVVSIAIHKTEPHHDIIGHAVGAGGGLEPAGAGRGLEQSGPPQCHQHPITTGDRRVRIRQLAQLHGPLLAHRIAVVGTTVYRIWSECWGALSDEDALAGYVRDHDNYDKATAPKMTDSQDFHRGNAMRTLARKHSDMVTAAFQQLGALAFSMMNDVKQVINDSDRVQTV